MPLQAAAMMHDVTVEAESGNESWCFGLLVSSSMSICNVACRLFSYATAKYGVEVERKMMVLDYFVSTVILRESYFLAAVQATGLF